MANLYESAINSPDNLIAGPSDVIAIAGVVVSGEGILGRGSVLGQITASEKYDLVVSDGADDGSRTAAAILAQDIDATSEDVTCAVFIGGEFNENALSFGGTDDADTHRATLQSLGMILRPTVEVN
jgi:hypothetical protein